MKKINKLIMATLSLLVILSFAVSCDDMDSIQRKFTEKEEQVYLGKVDSIKTIPGFGRAQITWFIGSDPKVEQTVIYWNMRADSIVRDFTRTVPGLQKDSIIVENLPEGSTLFEFRNKNSQGESSLFSSATVTVWGASFAASLLGRKLTSTEYDYKQTNFTLGLSTSPDDDLKYSEIVYTDNTGVEKTLRIERETNTVKLSNFSDGAALRFRNIFFLAGGMDTVYSNYQTHNAPKAVFDKGTKLSLTGNSNSRYFERDGKSLYEWNAANDVIVYALNEDGSFSQTERYASLVPRSTYREFFFYDDDKFIGIGTNNAVSMHQIVDGQLVFVKTSAGAETFGSGFGMQTFLPAKGFFYSIQNGELRTWLANNNATWGSPNGTTVGTAFTYEPIILFNHQCLVGVDTEGFLWSIPITTSGSLGSKSRIGSGWNKFVKLVSVGTTLLGLDSNGNFDKFDFNATEKYWVLD
jgi:hypothetical protein